MPSFAMRALDRLRRRSRGLAAGSALALLVAPLVVLSGTAPASAAITTPFRQMFSVNTNGAVIVRGNTLMTCVDSTACSTARAATSGTTNVNNNDYNSQFVDVDGDATTFDSSSAQLSVPAGGSVLYAALVWGGRTETSGTPAPDATLRGQAKLKVPGASAYETVVADRVDELSPGVPGAYQGFLDVTDQVRAAGSGSYTVADVQAARTIDRYAGWSLVVVVSDPSAPARNLTVYSGFGSVTTGASVSIPVSGFLTPPAGPVRTTLGLVSYEGDLGYQGDALALNGTVPTNARNPGNNTFNSSVTDGGVDTPGRSPAYANQLGFDADMVAADGVLANGATSATISLTTSQDVYYPGVVTFATDLYDPKLLGTKTVSDLDGGDVVAGDVLEYTVPVQNIGLDAATGSDFFDAVPTGTSYVPGSLSVDGAALTDAAGDDTGAYVADANQGHLLVHVGTGATATGGGSVPADSGATVYTVRFRVSVDAGTSDGQLLTNAAALTYRGQTTQASSASATNAVVSPVVATFPGGSNAAPTAVPHVLTFSPAPGARTATIPVLAGDTDPDGDALTVVGVTDAAGGPVTVNPDGTVTYSPGDAFAGRDVFTYSISDGNGHVATASVQVDVIDDAPTAVDDSRTTPAGAPLAVDVLANDTDGNGDALAVRSVDATSLRGGTITRPGDGTVRYVPAAGYRGVDTFDYVVEDSRGGSDTGTVSITVTNNAPDAGPDSYTTQPGVASSVAVLANDTDADADSLTAVLVTGPAYGALTLAADGTGSYTPDAGFVGTDTFTYRASDGQGGTSGPTTVTILVNAGPAAADDAQSTPTGTPVDVSVLDNDTDADGGVLVVTDAAPGTHGSTVVNADGTVAYTPDAGYAGPDSFDYTVSDGQGGTGTATARITVLDAPPVAGPDTAATGTGTPAADVDVLGNDTDPNIPGTGQVLAVTGATADNGADVVVNADDTLTVTPTSSFKGVVTVTYTVSDGAGGTAGGTLLVTVDNEAPVAVPDGPVRTATGAAVLLDVLGNDTDLNGDTLTLQASSLTTPVDADGTPRGTATVVAGQVRFVPSAGFAGTVTFRYTATDGTDTSTATVTVVVDDADPVAVDDTAATGTDQPVTVAVLGNDTDANIPGSGQVLTVTAATADSGATVVRNPDGTLTVSPAGGFTGTVTVTYQVSDGAGGADTGTVLVTVADAAPVAVADTATTPYGHAVAVDLLGNDTDPNGDTLAVVAGSASAPLDAAGTARGTVTVAGGTATYTPPAGFSGVVTFTYRVSDGTRQSTGTVTVTVGNAPPVAVPNSSTVTEGGSITIDVLGNDTDPDGGTLSLVAVTQPAHGTVTIVDGRIVYTSDGDFTGTDTFTYTVSDGQGGTTTSTVSVAVTADASTTGTDGGTGTGTGTGGGTSGSGPGATEALVPTSVPAGTGGQAARGDAPTPGAVRLVAAGVLALVGGLALLAVRRRRTAAGS